MDASEREHLNTSEKQLEHSLASLLRISDRLNSTLDLDSLLDALLEEVIELTRAESGCAGLRTAEEMSCDRFLNAQGLVSFRDDDSGSGSGWSGWLLTHGTPYLTNDALNDTAIVPEVRERFGVTSGMSIPIQHGLTYRKLASLASFSQSLTIASDLEQVLEVVGYHFETAFQRGIVILLPVDEVLTLRFRTPEFVVTPEELKVATWCWEQGQEAGASTASLSNAQAYYLPLAVRGQVIGVLGMESKPSAWFSHPRRELLAGFIGQSALAIERGLLEQRVRRLRFLAESDRVQNALLTAISHEVRVPLAAITAAISGLLSFRYDRAPERPLLETAELEVKRLHRLMNNLLSVTRLQAGMSQVKLEPCDLLDIVGAALEELGTLANKREISLEIPADLPLVAMDFDLITQVLVNLFSNAIKFSPSNHPIQLSSRINNGNLEVSLADQPRDRRTQRRSRAGLSKISQARTVHFARWPWSRPFHLQRIHRSTSRTHYPGA